MVTFHQWISGGPLVCMGKPFNLYIHAAVCQVVADLGWGGWAVFMKEK